MSKRQKPIDYQPPALDIEFSPFDDEALRRVIKATRYRPKLDGSDSRVRILERLNGAAMLFQYQQQAMRRPSPTNEEKILKSIASASARLEKHLPVEWEKNGFTSERDQPHLARGVERMLRDALDEVVRTGGCGAVDDCIEILAEDTHKPDADDLLLKLAAIVPLARRAAEKSIAERTGAEAERGLVADREFITRLIDIYADLFGRRPGQCNSPQTGKPGGPLLRFVRACYAELGRNENDGPLHSRIKTLLDERKANARRA